MAYSVQKKIKFSKGQVAPELIERTDLDLYNSSAQEMTNLISTVYGGFRTRRGTRYMSDIYTSTTIGNATSNIGGTASNIQDLTNKYTSGNIGTARDLIKIDYNDVIVGGDFKIKNIKADYLKFFTANSSTTYTIPKDLEQVRIDCVASKGGNNGGKGGRVLCNIPVESGQLFNITVGNIPSNEYTATYNASDIRMGGNSYSDRIIVAGGGGSTSSRGAKGGAGGGLTGGDGATGYNVNSMGKGGTQTSGGAGGAGTPVSVGHYHNGESGTFGLGGNGYSDTAYEGNSGAGGAGWYGGGSGAGDWNKNGGYVAGGGGGSSYAKANYCTDVEHIQGYNDGKGYVSFGLVNAKILIMTSTDDVD